MERRETGRRGNKKCLRTRRRKTKIWAWRERNGLREDRRDQGHRAGARVGSKHPRARKSADHQSQLACFGTLKTLGEVL